MKHTAAFIKFCLVGAVSACVDIGVLYLLVEYASFGVLTAAATSFTLASIVGFFLNKSFTFQDSSSRTKTQYLKFFLVSLVGLGFTLLLLKLFVYWGIYYLLAKVFTVALVVIWNFTGNRLWTFKNHEASVL